MNVYCKKRIFLMSLLPDGSATNVFYTSIFLDPSSLAYSKLAKKCLAIVVTNDFSYSDESE